MQVVCEPVDILHYRKKLRLDELIKNKSVSTERSRTIDPSYKTPAHTADMLIQAASGLSVQTAGRCACVSGDDAHTYVPSSHPQYQRRNREERMLQTPELWSFNHAVDFLNVTSDMAAACHPNQGGTTRCEAKAGVLVDRSGFWRK